LAKSLKDTNFAHDDLSSGRVSGIATICEKQADETSTKVMTVIELSADIRAKIFATFLQFLYTGTTSLNVHDNYCFFLVTFLFNLVYLPCV